MLGQNFAERSLSMSLLKASGSEIRGGTISGPNNMRNSTRPADNDFAQSLLFKNDGTESENAMNFMQNLNNMLSREQRRESVKRI